MKYCPNCGKKNDFSAKFCSNCATAFVSLNIMTSNLSKPQPVANPHPIASPEISQEKPKATLGRISKFADLDSGDINDLDDNYTDTDINFNLINQMTGLEVEIDSSPKTGSTIGGLMQTGSEKGAKESLKNKKTKGPKVDRKKILDEIKKESSAIRGKRE